MNKLISAALACALMLMLFGSMAFAQQGTQPVTVSLIANSTAVEPGKPFKIGAVFKLEPGWHIYYRESGDTGLPTSVTLKLPEGFSQGELEWQKPKRFQEDGFTTYGYTDETVIALTIVPPADLKPGRKLEFQITLSWLACKKTCQPGRAALTLSLQSTDQKQAAQAINTERFVGLGYAGTKADLEREAHSRVGSVLDQKLTIEDGDTGNHSLLAYIALAFLGGLLLNCMPCVLPVISLKVLRFVQEAGQSRRRLISLGLAYAAGTVLTCITLALAVVLAKTCGYSVGWGFQFQSPLFLLGMATLLTIMSLGLFDLYFVQLSAGEGLGKLSDRKGVTGAFFTGVVATILSTPCTAPFLGSAVGFAFAQPWWVTIAIFSAIGSGLAAPYLVLTAHPACLRFLPKPGTWMVHFKECMGFVLLGSVVWLLFVLGRQAGPDGVVAALAFLLATSFAAWLYNRLGGLNASRQRRVVLAVVALTLTGGMLFLYTLPVLQATNQASASRAGTAAPVQSQSEIAWAPFSKEAVDKSVDDGKVVFIDCTADWCQTCKFNEATVLGSESVSQTFKKLGVAAFRADWTNNDAKITELLAKFGRASVPLYIILSPHRPTQPIVLPTLLSKQVLIEKLEEASRP